MEQDFGEALRWNIKAAEQGNATAMVNLGLMYARGEVATQSYEVAFGWFKQAADKSDPTAEYYLGTMFARDTEWNRITSGPSTTLGGLRIRGIRMHSFSLGYATSGGVALPKTSLEP